MDGKKNYEKPATTFERQVDILVERGMSIDDPDRARRYLSHINYYHLEAYWLPFEESREPHKFIDGTTFDSVLIYYLFDRELRLLLLDAIERIEISIKTQWAYTLGIKYGPHAHLNKDIFRFGNNYQTKINEIHKLRDKSDEKFIKHFHSTYNEYLPPLWAVCEIMSFGMMSLWIENIKLPCDRNAISRVYQLDEVIFCSFLHALTIFRNKCAHHCRVWNRCIKISIKSPKNPEELLRSISTDKASRNKLYNILCIMLHIMNIINPNHSWKKRIGKLLQKYPSIPVSAMGFPQEWKTLPIWNGVFDI